MLNIWLSNIIFLVSGAGIILSLRTRDVDKSLKWNIVSHLVVFVGNLILGTYTALVNNVMVLFRALLCKFRKFSVFWAIVLYILQTVVSVFVMESKFGVLVIVASLLSQVGYILIQDDSKELQYRTVKSLSSILYTVYYFASSAYVCGIVEIVLIFLSLRVIYLMVGKKKL